MVLTNPVDHSVLESIRDRWSPYRFEPRVVEPQKLVRCFEAARWAASSFNDQPWHWLVATRDDSAEFDRMVGCLMEANQSWARQAGALVLTVLRTSFAYNQKPNRVALHDLGQAAAHLALQAASEGLQTHQMGGVDLAKVRDEYSIPEGFEPQTGIAIGYPDLSEPADQNAVSLRDRETAARKRKPLGDQVFTGQWKAPAELLTRSGS
jgi:nitroreductase